MCIGVSVHAQEKPDRLAWIEHVKAKPGMEAQLEEAGKKHFAWHRRQGDTWSVYLWQVITGDDAGDYIVGTFGHTWKDYDAREAFNVADDKDAMASVGPFMQSDIPSIWRHLEDVSRPGDMTAGPAKFSQLTHYFVKPSKISVFIDALKEIKAALDEAKFPVRSNWYALASGGKGPHYVVATERNSWAEFAGPDKSMSKVLEEKLGARKATELIDEIREATTSFYSEILRFRPDLSYMPGK
ncbi:MAG: hypothetical protein ABR961_00885 [Thermoanaerobaculaceae bacterium]|jgi:hypothetical protein